MSSRQRHISLITLATIALTLTACQSGRFGSEISAQPEPQKLSQPDGMTVKSPADQPFNITFSSSSRTPGLDGTAESDASVEDSGSASARATVESAGQATAGFQLGHAITNDTTRQTDITVSLRFQYAFDVTEQPLLNLPGAQAALRLYARTEHGRLLRDIPLVDHSTESGPAQRESEEHLNFTLTLAPGETVNVFLAGQTQVNIEADRSASAKLELRGTRLEITTAPAPKVRTTGDEQS